MESITEEEFVERMKHHRVGWFLRDDYRAIIKSGMVLIDKKYEVLSSEV